MTDQIVNVPLLRKAVEWAEAEAAKPEAACQWDQGWWVTLPAERASQLGVSEVNCGTAYCIAGWTCFAAGETFQDSDVGLTQKVADGTHIGDRAADLLGISNGVASALFRSQNTIEDVRRIAENLAGERL